MNVHRLSLLALTAALVSGGCLMGQTPPSKVQRTHPPLLPWTSETAEHRKYLQETLEPAEIDPSLHYAITQDLIQRSRLSTAAYASYASAAASSTATAATTKSLLAYFPDAGAKWDQGNCGNCWVHGCTVASAISHAVKSGTTTVVSRQYFDSGFDGGSGYWACCGGLPDTFVTYYASKLKFIPETNKNANYIDGTGTGACPGKSTRALSSITQSPYYGVSAITDTVVPTLTVSQTTAIANIKALLAANKAVVFGFGFPTDAGWTDFYDFWENKTASAIYQIDKYNGVTDDGTGGGHIVCIVGYDDTDSTWVVLNSWGATTNRPSGTFKIPQKINYNTYCTFSDGSTAHVMDFNAINITWK